MSFHDCIAQAQIEGVLTGPEADRLHEAHRRNARNSANDAQAARQTFEAFEAEVMARRRQKLIAIRKNQQNVFDLRTHRDGKGRANIHEAGRAMLDATPFAARAGGVFQLHENIRGELHRTLGRVFTRFERDILGNTRNKAELNEVVDGLFGRSDISPEASAMVQALRIAFEKARVMFNERGGHIGFLEDWGLPQSHEWELVAEAGFEGWRDYVMPLLDRQKMIDGVTGRPFTDASLELALRDTWEAISTQGWSRRDPSGQPIGKAVGNRRADPRFLKFRDGESWRAYMEKFGEGDAFKVINDYLDGMARDIALMDRFGPNPEAGLEFIKQTIIKEGAMAKTPQAQNAAELTTKVMDQMYRHFTGEASIPHNKPFASVASETRQWLVSAQLGAAMLSAISDVGFQQITAAMNGLPGWRVAARQLALMNPANVGDRELAISLGLIADEASSVMSAQQRLYGEAWGGKTAQRFADGVMRASGLAPWTQAGRHAFGLEYLAFMARQSDQAFDALPKMLRGSFERYGVTPAQWDEVRRAITERNGGRYIDVNELADEKLARQIMMMIRQETHFAVPSVSLYGRTALAGTSPPGTIAGELSRSFLMYKNFGITLVMTHGRRMARQSTWRGKLGYGGALLTTSTMLGAVSLQLKEISKGRDPRPMGDENGIDPKFAMAAMMQGGGFGIFGDFIFSDANRFGGGLASTIAGPVFGAGEDVLYRGVVANAQKAIAGDADKINPGNDIVRLLERYTPGGSLWYGRLAYQRLVLDQIREMADPDHADRFKRLERRYERDYGQDHWWRPGELAPDRPADLSNAIGQAPD